MNALAPLPSMRPVASLIWIVLAMDELVRLIRTGLFIALIPLLILRRNLSTATATTR